MSTEDAVFAVIEALQMEGADFIIVGSYSSNLYGIPRATRDFSIVVAPWQNALPNLLEHLDSHWARESQTSREPATGTMREIYELKGSALKVEIFALSDDEHDQARFARRIRKPFTNQTVSFPTAEDVIIWKLRWARPKDLDDVRNVILVQEREASLDWPYIRNWSAKHGTTARLDEILASLPKRR